MKLNVIIPCFNKEQYLQRLLNSINSIIPKENYKDLFIYVVDDCSKYGKNYKEVIQLYKNLNITYLKTKKNSGPAIARNLGLDNIKSGDFICFWDDDDEIIYNPFLLLDKNYDIISTVWNFSSDNLIDSTVYMAPLQGLIYNQDFINKYNLRLCNVRYGMEDSIFRTLTFLLTEKIKNINTTFYKRDARPDSTFTRNITITKYGKDRDKTADTLDWIEDNCWLSLLYSEFQKYNIKFDNQILLIKFYSFFKEFYNKKLDDKFFKMGRKYQQDFLSICVLFVKQYLNSPIIINKMNDNKFDLLCFYAFNFCEYEPKEETLILSTKNIYAYCLKHSIPISDNLPILECFEVFTYNPISIIKIINYYCTYYYKLVSCFDTLY